MSQFQSGPDSFLTALRMMAGVRPTKTEAQVLVDAFRYKHPEISNMWQTPQPRTCEEDGHSWQYLGGDANGNTYYRCRCCGQESE